MQTKATSFVNYLDTGSLAFQSPCSEKHMKILQLPTEHVQLAQVLRAWKTSTVCYFMYQSIHPGTDWARESEILSD